MFLSFEKAETLVSDLGPQREFERTSGLPWFRTVGELESEYGLESWRDFLEVVPLRGVRALGFDASVEFRHRFVDGGRRAYPAYDFEAELNPYGQFERNHAWALDHLSKLFGLGPRIGDVYNCLRAYWDFGLIGVSVLTFRPDVEKHGPNSLYERYPDLWHVANLAVQSRLCAYREPVEMDVSDGFDLEGVAMGFGDFVTNRLLVRPAASSGIRVFRDRELGRVGVANACGGIVRPWMPDSRLGLSERTPARGGGSASLDLDGVQLLKTGSWDGLREAAARVAEFWGVALLLHSEPDE